jgi:hypothetical protein
MELQFESCREDGEQVDETVPADAHCEAGGERAFRDILLQVGKNPFGVRFVASAGGHGAAIRRPALGLCFGLHKGGQILATPLLMSSARAHRKLAPAGIPFAIGAIWPRTAKSAEPDTAIPAP